MELKKNDIIELDITDAGFNGEGVGHIEGTTVFVPFALTGERVRAHVVKVKGSLAFTFLVSVLRPSPFRVVPACPSFTKCGGCTAQNLDYEKQLEQKSAAVKTTLYKAVGEVNVLPCRPSEPPYGYRNKASFPVRGRPGALGFFAAGSHRHVKVSRCPVSRPSLEKTLLIFNEYFAAEAVAGYEEESGGGEVRHVTAREIDGHLYIAMVVTSAFKRDLKALSATLDREFGGDYEFYLNFNDSRGNGIYGKQFQFVAGRERAVQFAGVKFTHHPAAFFQVNDGVQEQLVRHVTGYLSDCESVADCYCGAGLLSVLLAKSGKSVTGIELEPKAVEAAKKAAELSGAESVRFICGDCAKYTREISADAVVLDPPRQGCAAEVLAAVKDSGAKRLVYISCNPATLGRDLKVLEQTYRVVSVTPFDMFAQTGEVECAAFLEKI